MPCDFLLSPDYIPTVLDRATAWAFLIVVVLISTWLIVLLISVKTPAKDPPKSNPSKRHRERLNGELDHLASLLPFEQSVISKLDKLSILRLAVSYLRTKSFFQSVLPVRYGIESHLMNRSHLFLEPGFSEGESILQALYGFLFVVTCDGEVFFASRTVEQYLGFHQSDIIHQSVMELIHSEDREEFKRQLTWNALLPGEKSAISLHEIMSPENAAHLHRSFTVRFRCLLDNTSGFITLEINGWIRVLHGQGPHSEEPQLALFATCSPFGPLSLFDIPSREMTFKTKHKMDFSPVTMDSRGKTLFAYTDQELANRSGYDLIHPDDLNYFSCAHQELIKTGSSGLISYRWQTKLQQWIWMQSSCKVIYKNSKPDFIICTHRQLTEDEGQDLFSKRGNEFKLPYPLLDIDMCAGFGFGDDDMSTKSKPSKSKKKSSSGTGTASTNGGSSSGQLNGMATPNGASMYDGGVGVHQGAGKECHSGGGSGKKKKSNTSASSGAAAATAATAACIIGGLPPYCAYPTGFAPYDGGGGAMMASAGDPLKATESLYSYNPSSFGFDATDMYRAQGAYGALHAATTMYQHHQQQQHQAVSQEPYRLDMVDKHQTYFLDSHSRQYQPSHHHLSPALPPAPYGNAISGYGSGVNCVGSEFGPPAATSKYGYDVSGVPCAYGFDSYSLDFSKRMDCTDFSQISQIHPEMKRTYAFDYTSHAHSTHASSYPPHNNLLDPQNIHERYAAANRLGVTSLDPVDLRNTSGLFGTSSFMSTVDTSISGGGATSSPGFSAGNNTSTFSGINHPIPSQASSSMFKPVAISAQSASSTSSIPPSLATNTTQNQPVGDSKDMSSPDVNPSLSSLVLPSASYDQQHNLPFSLPHNSVIKSTRQRNAQPPTSGENCDLSTPQSRGSPTNSPWRYCSKSEGSHTVSPMSSLPHLTPGGDLNEKMGEHKFSCENPQDPLNTNNDLSCSTKENSMTGIPVSVVRQSSWTQSNGQPNNGSNNSDHVYNNTSPNDGNNNSNRSSSIDPNSTNNLHSNNRSDDISNTTAHLMNNNNNSIHGDICPTGVNQGNRLQSEKEWIPTDLYPKPPRVLFSDPCHSMKHLGLKVYERGDNPLLSFSEMTHSLMSSTY